MKSYLKTKDFSVTGEDFELQYDADFELLITTPQPKELDKYYQSEDYISHTDSKKTLVDKIYQGVKRYSLKRKLNLISSFTGTTHRTLLDVGAGTGDFARIAKTNGWMVEGIEPNLEAKTRAQEKGATIYDDLESVSDKKYDVITLWHVLEHLPKLDEQVLKLTALLKEEGTLVVAVPNFKSLDAKYYKEFWAAYDVPRHLWHFSRKSIEKLFSKYQMQVIETKPMVFDAFYVSLLSEKYKKGKSNFLKAFCMGLWSNISAWKTKEYSSVIYILKKS